MRLQVRARVAHRRTLLAEPNRLGQAPLKAERAARKLGSEAKAVMAVMPSSARRARS
jgi:hypothetical protein